MGKRMDELPLDDTPLSEDRFTPVDKDAPDERDQEWYQFLGEIDDLLATGEYDWAYDSLSGIHETVEKTHRVTDGQKRAVTNIAKRGEARGTNSSRRYEGWGRWR